MAKPSIPTDLASLKPIVEAMIFAGEEPLGPRTLLRLLFEEEKKGVEGAANGQVVQEDSLFTVQPDDVEEGAEEPGAEGEEKGDEHDDEAGESVPKGKPGQIGQKELRAIIDDLNDTYEQTGRSFRIIEIAGGFQFATTREYGEFVGLLSRDRMRRKLSPAALETLAIVAYRQPVTKPEVEAIRGVNCDQVLLSLLERNLIAISGRADTVGKPLLYSTTDEFLRAFGLNSLNDLPKLRELEELMEEDAHSPTKPEIIPEAVADELLELTYHPEEGKEGEQEEAKEETTPETEEGGTGEADRAGEAGNAESSGSEAGDESPVERIDETGPEVETAAVPESGIEEVVEVGVIVAIEDGEVSEVIEVVEIVEGIEEENEAEGEEVDEVLADETDNGEDESEPSDEDELLSEPGDGSGGEKE